MSHSGTKGLESARMIRILEVELVVASGRMKIMLHQRPGNVLYVKDRKQRPVGTSLYYLINSSVISATLLFVELVVCTRPVYTPQFRKNGGAPPAYHDGERNSCTA